MYRNLIEKFMKRRLGFLLLVLGLPLTAFLQQNNAGSVLAITHVNVIDATGAPLRRDMTVVIRQELTKLRCRFHRLADWNE